MSRPQVIDDEDHERVHDRVAAVDVAKDTGMVCTRTPHPSRPGARRSTVWTVKARMKAIRTLGRQLKKDGIEIVTLESTSDYWRRFSRDRGEHSSALLPQVELRAGRRDITGGLFSIRPVPTRRQTRRLTRGIDAPHLHRHRGEPSHAQHQDDHQSGDGERRLDRGGTLSSLRRWCSARG